MNSAPTHRSKSGNMRQRVVHNLLLLGSGSGLAAFLSLLTSATNSRALTITNLGFYLLLQSLALLIAGLISFSTQQPIIKLGVAALEDGQVRRFERLVGLGLMLDFSAAFVTAVAALAIVLALPDMIGLSRELTTPALTVAASLLFQGFKTSEGIFRVFNRFGLMGSVQVAVAAIQLVAALLLWWFDAPFFWYGILIAAVVALPSVAQLILSLKLMRSNNMRPRLWKGGEDTIDDRREFLAYCWTTSIMSSCDTVRNNGDTALVGFIVSVEGAAIYGVAKQLAGVVRKATIIYASVLFPEIASMAAAQAYALARTTLRRASLIGVAATVVLVLGTVIFGKLALTLIFGPEFAAGDLTLILLIMAAGLQIVSATYSMFVQTFINPRHLLSAYFVATAAFVLSAIFSLHLFGIAGAGAAQVLFVIALMAACHWILRRKRAFKESAVEN